MARRGWGRDGARGQAIVEFAIAFPVFLVMVMGLLEGGRLVWSYVTLSHAVQEGGRTAVLADTSGESAVKSKVVAAAGPLTVATGNVTIKVTDKSSGTTKGFRARDVGDRVEVKATFAFTPVVTSLFGGKTTLTLTGSTELMVE
ncbi:MAG: hypothetical protein QOF33_1694 [Thermomicrobiales bacterium]|jgi:Flp pilus assembly protein TadG|nr:hypothetical protein [Thermomicrobiales bacterium]MEA2526099.1 hypothetical protein [Thermomicrobiales bacterium]MEA2583609.1 hypothetical protein [Thermomicrobiales bacterium]